MGTKQIIDQYFKLMKEVHEAFGYEEDWVVIPLDDARDYYWQLSDNTFFGGSEGGVRFADTPELLEDEEAGQYYENSIYTQRFLPKYVYRTEDYTMISVDTHTDGNKFLQIFDNAKEVKD
jgi:hypothetical protein